MRATVDDAGLIRKQVHEARQIRDAEWVDFSAAMRRMIACMDVSEDVVWQLSLSITMYST